MASSATVGTAVVKLEFDGKNVKASLKGVEGEARTHGTNAGTTFGNALTVAAGNLIAKGMSTVFQKISSGMDNAIKRVDTLNNSEKVFTAMGYAADATSKSMDTLTSYLDGLPTSMTTAVNGVQSLAASFGGIEKGTQTFIDMNNAGLAFGATTEQIENAINQLGQLSLDGPLDAQTWNSLRNSGFSPVFAAMAKEAKMTVGELKEDFSADGTKTVGDFLDALHKLSTEGGADMESLSELARKNTEGIGTALENVQNRIGKAIAKVIDHIGSEKIAGMINDISASFMQMADVVIAVIDFIAAHWDIISPILATLGTVAGTIIAINVALKAYHKIQTAVNGVAQIFGKTLGGVSSGISKTADAVSKSSLGSGLSKIGDMFKKLAEAIKSAVKGIGEILNELANAIIEPIKTVLKGVGEAIAGFFKAMADPQILMGAVMFVAAAASIAAAIWLIGSAVGAIMPVLLDLFNNIIMPIAQFIANTVLSLIDAVTQAIVVLTNNAIIPLQQLMLDTFITVLQTVAEVVTNLTQGAIIPLIDTLSGAFVNIVQTVANLLTGVLNAALRGIADITVAVGDGFVKMGNAIKTALDGVRGVLGTFADLIKSIAEAAVAIVSMVTGHSINYGKGYAHLFAKGGKVEGPGTETSDSIPARLSAGEYVINAASAKNIGYDVLDALNGSGNDYAPSIASDIEDSYGGIGSGVINVYMTNEINNELDADEIGRVMIQSIRRAA